MPPKLERFERLYQCTRCKHKFVKHITADEVQDVKCPRSCPAKVDDITEQEEKAFQKRRAEVAARLEARAEKEAAEKEAKEEALRKSKK